MFICWRYEIQIEKLKKKYIEIQKKVYRNTKNVNFRKQNGDIFLVQMFHNPMGY